MSPSKPTTLIIGCGYLGQRVAKILTAAGHAVVGTTRDAAGERAAALAAEGLEVAELDLTRTQDSEVLKQRFTSVIYCVAPGRGGDAELAFGEGPLRCLRAVDQTALERFVYVSSTGVYPQRDGAWLDEDSSTEPGDGPAAASPRAAILREAEAALQAGDAGPAAIVIRLGGLYGPGRSPIDWLRPMAFRKQMSGSAGAYMNWIHIDDAAAAVAAAAQRGEPGRVYLGTDGAPVSRRDFYAHAAALAGVDPPELDESEEAALADAGKRLRNTRLVEELGVTLQFPTYRAGLDALKPI